MLSGGAPKNFTHWTYTDCCFYMSSLSSAKLWRHFYNLLQRRFLLTLSSKGNDIPTNPSKMLPGLRSHPILVHIFHAGLQWGHLAPLILQKAACFPSCFQRSTDTDVFLDHSHSERKPNKVVSEDRANSWIAVWSLTSTTYQRHLWHPKMIISTIVVQLHAEQSSKRNKEWISLFMGV